MPMPGSSNQEPLAEAETNMLQRLEQLQMQTSNILKRLHSTTTFSETSSPDPVNENDIVAESSNSPASIDNVDSLAEAMGNVKINEHEEKQASIPNAITKDKPSHDHGETPQIPTSISPSKMKVKARAIRPSVKPNRDSSLINQHQQPSPSRSSGRLSTGVQNTRLSASGNSHAPVRPPSSAGARSSFPFSSSPKAALSTPKSPALANPQVHRSRSSLGARPPSRITVNSTSNSHMQATAPGVQPKPSVGVKVSTSAASPKVPVRQANGASVIRPDTRSGITRPMSRSMGLSSAGLRGKQPTTHTPTVPKTKANVHATILRPSTSAYTVRPGSRILRDPDTSHDLANHASNSSLRTSSSLAVRSPPSNTVNRSPSRLEQTGASIKNSSAKIMRPSTAAEVRSPSRSTAARTPSRLGQTGGFSKNPTAKVMRPGTSAGIHSPARSTAPRAPSRLEQTGVNVKKSNVKVIRPGTAAGIRSPSRGPVPKAPSRLEQTGVNAKNSGAKIMRPGTASGIRSPSRTTAPRAPSRLEQTGVNVKNSSAKVMRPDTSSGVRSPSRLAQASVSSKTPINGVRARALNTVRPASSNRERPASSLRVRASSRSLQHPSIIRPTTSLQRERSKISGIPSPLPEDVNISNIREPSESLDLNKIN
ncbi:microtubule-associated protein [Schizosaccharomyces cryophilus OY26]|uniref:Microtubule-associated protein n=1 Tax=Schizosaccharomyces cryophilus (strain OY26 / ATCC MYA-4695 / CBS 11777 / NBRC 106824 / NRRL Y48691) TaxID=653667 RepID=S9W5L0_SCHCR|nr:microtubule-associated protein [Schizosaccharomyces cryophilus OY26]EPY53844.1 microtubule-associated protein [Schizosaccharomyces cryophilus OY26]